MDIYPFFQTTSQATFLEADFSSTRIVSQVVNGYLDPSSNPGSVLQFAANGGPGEVANLRQNERSYGHRNGSYGGMEYEAKMAIPAGMLGINQFVGARSVGTFGTKHLEG